MTSAECLPQVGFWCISWSSTTIRALVQAREMRVEHFQQLTFQVKPIDFKVKCVIFVKVAISVVW